MNEVLKSLGAALRRLYDSAVHKPMPWRMIDKLATLEEACERRDGDTPSGAESNARVIEPSKLDGKSKPDL